MPAPVAVLPLNLFSTKDIKNHKDSDRLITQTQTLYFNVISFSLIIINQKTLLYLDVVFYIAEIMSEVLYAY